MKKKRVFMVLGIIVLVLLVLGLVGTMGVKKYIDATPVVEAKADLINVYVEETINIEDMFNIQNAVSIRLYADEPEKVQILDDNKGIKTSSIPTTVNVHVSAIGSNSETRDASIKVVIMPALE